MISDPTMIGLSVYDLIEKNCTFFLKNDDRISMLNYVDKTIFFIHQEGVRFYNVLQD